MEGCCDCHSCCSARHRRVEWIEMEHLVYCVLLEGDGIVNEISVPPFLPVRWLYFF